ncbi:MAG: thioredoxin domain-containing protein [Patescibacteria group bacterium]
MNEQQHEIHDPAAMPPEHMTKKQRRDQKRQEKLEAREQAQKAAQRKSMLMWLGVLVGLGLIVWAIIGLSGNDGSTAVTTISTVTEQDQVKGSDNPIVTLVEYSDFQCPACATYYPMVAQLEQQYGDSLAIVYRHYPLKSIHPLAETAARAAEAAGRQGQFWQMHDKLFDSQNSWTRLSSDEAEETFTRFASELGLDEVQFAEDIDSDEVADKVKHDEQSALRAGLRGTPSFFLDGNQIPNPRGYDDFAFVVQNAIENKLNNVQ